ncbi:hypothetical protein OHB26_20690 [Nocardia sp. NBC_01503]|uniref:DUF4190 domain-containing protein n=1 Tax=Nocardia sp. NBC_01503 TaxID=2975997 RepID=UPI002E7B660A|nr:hypothetical protein [Nocardia sp. NBC_01503]WTL29420.1 hypothetical protein OHB26_20690 [Nocardia sp. NBC_01503]
MQRDHDSEPTDWGWEPPLVPEPAPTVDSPETPSEQPETNRLAVVSLILGLLGICFFAVPLAMIALAQISNRGQEGKVYARAAMAASGCYLLVGVLAMVFFNPGRSTEEKAATPAALTRTLSVGDCVESVRESDLIASIPTVPCDQPHAAEVITQFPMTGPWPGRDESARRADSRCTEELTPALITSPMVTELRSFIYFPANEIQWRNNPVANCLVMRTDGKDLTLKIPR